MAGCLISSATQAQVAGGGVGGGGAGSSGNWVVIEIAGNWELSTRATITGQLVQVSPSGTTTTATQNPIANASIWGVAGTATAKSSMKREFKVRWIGSGAPEKYAYVKLLSSVSYWNTPNTGASVVVGLPPVQAVGDPDEVGSIVAAGRKIAKITVGTDGTAIFNVDNSITATATAPISLVPVTNEGVLNSSGTLILKALGLYYDSNTRMVDVTPTGPNVYSWPAGGDDFERQRAEFAVSLTHTWVNANPYPIGPPLPVLELSGAMYSVWVPVGYLGSWSAPQLSSGVSTGSRTEKFDLGGNLSNIEIANDYSLEDLAAMRLSPKEVTVTINGSDPQSTIQGPFQGELKASVWAPERVIATGEDTVTDVSVREINGCDSVTVAAGQDETLEVNSVTTTEWSAEVSVVGGLSGEIDKVGVKADCGFKLGYKHSVALGGKHSKHVQPTVRTKYWYEVTTTVTNMNRALASYGDRGYIADYSNRILYSKKPTRNGEFKWEELP